MEHQKSKKMKWLALLIVVAVIVVVGILLYRKLMALLFGGAVAASIEDVYATIWSCMPAIALSGVVILAAIVVSIVVLRKGKALKRLVRVNAVIAVVLALAISANWICLGLQYTLVNKLMNSSDGLSDTTREESLALTEDIVGEGIVLLKNDDNALPLSTDTKLNVFGWGSTMPIYGGSGSGSVDESTAVSLLQGLKNAGYELNDALSEFYTAYRSDRPAVGTNGVDWTIPQPTIESYDEAGLFEEAKAFSDTALIVITRSGGEGMDLPERYSSESSYNKSQIGTDVVYSTQEDDIDTDKTYLELSNREIDLVERVTQEFDRVYVIINSANPMELGWLEEYQSIQAALWVGGAGAYGFNALGKVLSGEINPSGRLVDTYVYDVRTTPNYNNYGNFQYTNLEEITGSQEDVAKFINYVEGIYVGYKFYETAAVEGLIDYDATVQYPFGYGLSYTTFDKTISNFQADGSEITLEVTVTNTGDIAGKDVAQIYFTPPYYNGGIEKASTNLVEFAKTDLLQPGESQTLTISFSYEDMASYDDLGYGCYVLEHGDYVITLNENAHTVLDSETITLDNDVIYDDAHDGARSTDQVAAVNQFDFARGDVTYLSRADGFANYAQATAAPTNFVMSQEDIANFHCKHNFDAGQYDDPDAQMPTTGADNGLTIQDMTGLDYNDEQWELLLDQLTVDEMALLVANGGFQTVAVESINSPSTTDCDGPAGVWSLFTASIRGTAFPSAVVLASTWNKDLAQQRGERIGVECNELGVTGWYGPGMNIHRSPLSGRNFEYYSEDATLSYFMGAEEVSAVASQGVMVYVKHFALNDQETNRTFGVCTWATEQSIREIYLKAFEGAFKEGKSTAVMTAFNSVGPQWAGSCPALLQSVLRQEWGFHGAVVTDAMDPLADYYMDLNEGIRTGLTKGLAMGGTVEQISDRESVGTVVALRQAAHDTLYAVANSNAMDKNTGAPAWVVTFLVCDVILLLVLAGCEVLVIRMYRKAGRKQ